MQVVDASLFIKRFIAHATEGELSMPEWHRILTELRLGLAGRPADGRSWTQVIQDVERRYKLLSEQPALLIEQFRSCAAFIAHELPLEARARLLAQLWRLAGADGEVTAMERLFLHQVEYGWGLGARTRAV